MEVKNNTNKLLIVIIILLSLLVIGLGGYFVYTNIDNPNENNEQTETENKEENKNKDENTKVESISIYSQTVQDAMKKIEPITCESDNVAFCYYEEVKGEYYGLLYRNNKLLAKDLSTKIKLDLAARNIEREQYTPIENSCIKSVSENIFIQKYHDIFGKSSTYQWVDNSEQPYPFIYSHKKDNRVYTKSCGGDSMGPGHLIITELSYAEKMDDELYIYELMAVISSKENEEKAKVYNDLDEKNLITSDLFSVVNSQELFGKYANKLSEYKYTFKLEDGNYYFYSVEKVK